MLVLEVGRRNIDRGVCDWKQGGRGDTARTVRHVVSNKHSSYDTDESTPGCGTHNDTNIVGSGIGSVSRHKLGIVGGSIGY